MQRLLKLVTASWRLRRAWARWAAPYCCGRRGLELGERQRLNNRRRLAKRFGR